MIIDLLGPSLDLVFEYNRQNISPKSILLLFQQMLSRIEFIHSRHLIHRDIKPENFLIGCKKNSNIIFLIDYGLSKKYRDPKSGEHIPYKDNKPLTGTARYASIFTHLGVEQSRRDDLECLGYSLIYLNNGRLPWQGIKAKNSKEKNILIMNKKITLPLKDLCKDLPNEIVLYFEYVRALNFEEKPDYDYLNILIKKALSAIGPMESIYSFEWNKWIESKEKEREI